MYKRQDLETERLFLKCIGYDDTEFFYKQFTTDEVNQYLFDIEPFDSMEEAQKWIGFYLAVSYTHLDVYKRQDY